MPSKYLPKIKVSTAKGMAKNLLATKGGQKISDTAFKKFIKQDKNLKKLTYSSDKSTVSKFQAKKILGQVAKDAAASEKYKVSRFAQKLGIRQSGEEIHVSDIALNKAYQRGTEEELAAATKPTGPTAEETRRQKRHDEAIKTFHKRDRADEMHKEQVQPQQKSQEKRAFSPVARTAFTGAPTPANQTANTLSDQTSTLTQQNTNTDTNLIPVLVLPLHNPLGSMTNLGWLAQKIHKLIVQTLKALQMFRMIERPAEQQNTIDINDNGALHQATIHARAQLCVFGTIQKTGERLDIAVTMLNTENNQRLTLVHITDESGDIFSLERKIAWQITNAIQEKPSEKQTELPPDRPVDELPI